MSPLGPLTVLGQGSCSPHPSPHPLAGSRPPFPVPQPPVRLAHALEIFPLNRAHGGRAEICSSFLSFLILNKEDVPVSPCFHRRQPG